MPGSIRQKVCELILVWMMKGTVTSSLGRAAHAAGCARCGAGATCSAIQYHLFCGPGSRERTVLLRDAELHRASQLASVWEEAVRVQG
jgi:hypothetical protein